MLRRDLIKALSAASLAATPAMAQVPKLIGVKIKVTDVKIRRLKLIKDIGVFVGWAGPWDEHRVVVGGGSFIEVHTDQGLIGIGPGIDPVQLPRIKHDLIGRDPFDLQTIRGDMTDVNGMGSERRLAAIAPPESKSSDATLMPLGVAAGRADGTTADRRNAAVEIALWDIIGKACNQPLYKIWGPVSDTVKAYASQARLGTPDERARLALQLKDAGWQGMKLRAHFATMKDDIALVEKCRKAVGDDWDIMVDANQATNAFLSPDVQWDFNRAARTAKAYDDMNVYWLEEPLPRYDYDGLAELNKRVEMPLAGGEGNTGLHEFRDLLDKGCFDIVQPEVLLEGPMEIRKIAALAEAMNKRISPHLAEGRIGTVCNMHLIASLPNAEYLEIEHDLPLREYGYDLGMFEEPLVLQKGGVFNVPQGPGLGITVKKDWIES